MGEAPTSGVRGICIIWLELAAGTGTAQAAVVTGDRTDPVAIVVEDFRVLLG